MCDNFTRAGAAQRGLGMGGSIDRGEYGAAGARILGTGSFLPGAPVMNDEVVRSLPAGVTTAEWIATHTGIRQRHWAGSDQATSDLGAAAARDALAAAGIDAADLDHILLCSTTADWTSPAAASRVQHLLGATCPAEDKQVACASWLFGLDHAARLCATGAGAVLVVGADVKSRFVAPDDHRLRPVLADGAGAIVVGPGDPSKGGLRNVVLHSDGAHTGNLYTPAGGSRMPASAETVRDGLHHVHMTVAGGRIRDDAVEIMSASILAALHPLGLGLGDVDHFVVHQANLAIVRCIAEELAVPLDRFPITIDRTGNIVAGTLPFTLDDVVHRGMLSPGDVVVMATAGAGYAGGAAVYEVTEP